MREFSFCHVYLLLIGRFRFFFLLLLLEKEKARNDKSTSVADRERGDVWIFANERITFLLWKNVLVTNRMFTSINERSKKPDRYQPMFFAFFRTRIIRSKSLENLHDRQQQQQQQRKEGKLNKRIVLRIDQTPSL